VRVFVDPDRLAMGSLLLRGDEHHYLARVRRAHVGDVIELVDGEGRRARALIEAITMDGTTLRVEAPEDIPALPPFIRALVPLIKGDRMDTCLEKLVEVGVDQIIVWPAERSIVRLHDDRRDVRIAKYNLATQAAARQCGRAQVPPVVAAMDLASAIATLPDTIGLVLDPLAEGNVADALRLAAFSIGSSKSGVMAHITQSGSIAIPEDSMVGRIGDVTIASGPEGGLTPDERKLLSAFFGVNLGSRILRAETAPVVCCALVRAATRS
jgi:16S rRNA (uracil1498-N3)-methyltransferase